MVANSIALHLARQPAPRDLLASWQCKILRGLDTLRRNCANLANRILQDPGFGYSRILQCGRLPPSSAQNARDDGTLLALIWRQLALQGIHMMDAVFVLATLVFFTATWAYSQGCAHI